MTHLFFEHVGSQPVDPVLEIGRMWAKDPNSEKINLGIGIYLDEKGKCPVLKAVKEAEEFLIENEVSKTYLPIEGDHDFLEETKKLLFLENAPLVTAAQTLGGTGALRVLADYLRLEWNHPIYVSDPTWANHHGVFKAAGLEVRTYPYYDRTTHTAKKGEFFDFLHRLEKGSILLLHGCCHNPTGIDFTHSEWDLILDCCLKKGLLPLFDIAYLGLGDGIDKDRYAVNTFFKSGIEMCVAFSYSKTMDLYRERVGALMIVNRSHTHEGMQSTIKQIIRRNYSSPPAHGALVVKTVLTDLKRKKLWLDELEEHRLRSCAMRELILKEFGGWIQHKKEFQEAKGFFSYLGISKEAVLELRKESIYLLDDSRLNVLGVNRANIGRLKQVFSRLSHG